MRMRHSAKARTNGSTGAPVTKGSAMPYPRGSNRQSKIKAVPQAVFGTKPKRTMPNLRASTYNYGKGV